MTKEGDEKAEGEPRKPELHPETLVDLTPENAEEVQGGAARANHTSCCDTSTPSTSCSACGSL